MAAALASSFDFPVTKLSKVKSEENVMLLLNDSLLSSDNIVISASIFCDIPPTSKLKLYSEFSRRFKKNSLRFSFAQSTPY